MRRASRPFVALFLALTLAVGASSLYQREHAGAPEQAHPGNSDLISPPDAAAVRRLNAKGVVTRRLIAGELTLADATAWFQYLDAALPEPGAEASAITDGLPDGERYGRQVIRWARGQMDRASPSQAARLERRLQAELDAILRRDGAAASLELE